MNQFRAVQALRGVHWGEAPFGVVDGAKTPNPRKRCARRGAGGDRKAPCGKTTPIQRIAQTLIPPGGVRGLASPPTLDRKPATCAVVFAAFRKESFLTRVNGREKGEALRPVSECNPRESGYATFSKPPLTVRIPPGDAAWWRTPPGGYRTDRIPVPLHAPDEGAPDGW